MRHVADGRKSETRVKEETRQAGRHSIPTIATPQPVAAKLCVPLVLNK